MRITRTTYIVGLIFLTVLACGQFTAVTVAFPANPKISSEQPLYTRLNKEVYLKGTEFPKGTYYVWMSKPDQSSTYHTGITIQVASDVSIPSETKIPISSDYPFGTYRVSISASASFDTSIAYCHFGLWGTDRSVYQRTETVRILGGGLWPGSSVQVTVRNPLGSFVFIQPSPQT